MKRNNRRNETKKENKQQNNINRWNDINGELILFYNEEYDSFSTSLKDNKEDTERKNVYINVFTSKKCSDKIFDNFDDYLYENKENMLKIDITSGWLTAYNGKVQLFINDIK